MYRSVYILFFACLGFLLMPTQTYACNMSNAPSQKVNTPTSASKKDDCKDACTHQQNKKNHCGNDCNNALCKCPTNSNTSFFYSNSFSFGKTKVYVTPSFLNYETNISKGFYSIWLIPKIG